MTRPDQVNVAAARTLTVQEHLDSMFAAGLASLHAEDFAAAENYLLDALAQAEAIGDQQSQLMALIHLTSISRRRRRIEQARSLIARGIELANAAEPSVHTGAMFGHYGWLAWQEHNGIVVREYAAITMGLWQSAKPYPYRWIILWPLIAAVMDQGFVQEAIGYTRGLLEDGQQATPAPLESALRGTLAAWEAGDLPGARDQLHCALELAQEHGLL